MKFRLRIFRDFLDKILPSKTYGIYPSKSGLALILLILFVISAILFLRNSEKNEILFLQDEHEKIQLMIQSYLREMTGLELNENDRMYKDRKLKELRVQLNEIKKKIDQKKEIWLID